ncbi:PepSY domain-containing protein [Salipiger abyssi]|uniref:PepSY domain-containing protein n=1 Tax=Salipiger abyssi TaxID=1250539 RepID=UPI00405A2A78
MFRSACIAITAATLTALPVAADTPSPAQTEQILAMLAEMQCEMDPDDIEMEDSGYELDDVYCADGQYDIDLDADLNVTNKRKE